jgi:naphthalene 1,2-dioxygenase system ferredoxin subunit
MRHRVLTSLDLPDGSMTGVTAVDQPIALYRIGGYVYATSNVCTHQAAFLSDGYLEGEYVECPLHQGRFCVTTGKAVDGPVEQDLQTYPAYEEEGSIYVDID